MALPDPFSDVEQLQALVRRTLNREVREHFSDLGGDDWDPEVGTTRGQMRYCLTHKDDDPLLLTVGRMMLYYFTYGRARDLQPPQYSIPTLDYQASHKYRPQIHLMFYQLQSDVDTSLDNSSINAQPVQGQISFRLENETSESISMTDLERYANRIKTSFGAAGGYRWHKGKVTVSYFDPSKGYRLKLFCRDKAEGKQLIEQVLDIQQHSPDWQYMTSVEAEEPLERYPTIPTPRTKRILGENREQPRQRPVVQVRYRYSLIHIHGLKRPIPLHSLTRTFKNPIAS